jgi:orotidine-5'-phosphate decarboxylase
MDVQDRVIVALDVATAHEARALVNALGDDCTFYKIGLQLFTSEGPVFVRELVAAGKKVFLDLKLHEIPNSVAGAVNSAGALGVSMVTVHASAGSAALRAAVDAARSFPHLQIIAITVVTSLGSDDLQEIGVVGHLQYQVMRLAVLAEKAGCHGVVASPQEAAALRAMLQAGTAIITPGIRLEGDALNDQTRVATPGGAVRAGASHLVVGRSVSQASSPRAAVQKIYVELDAVFATTE